MRKKKKLVIIILVLFISIGFAYLSTTLNLNGAITFNENNWDIHFENIKVISTDVSYSTLEIDSNDSTSINSSINFKEPSEIFEYSVDVVNGGGIDAVFDSLTNNLDSTNEDYITIDIKYCDGTSINQNDILRMGQSKRIRVKVIYNLDIDELPSISTTNITTTINYQNINVRNISYNRKVWNYDFTGYEQLFITPKTGTYKVELWGASGGGSGSGGNGAAGAYVSGNISLIKGNKFYVYVGEHPTKSYGECNTSNDNATFNGSRYGSCSTGGGATDIRLSSTTNWYDVVPLRSRIMVAGAGGGKIYQTGVAGVGGTFKGQDGTGLSSQVLPSFTVGAGGTQTGLNFGYSGSSTTTGGGGYYAGTSGYGGNAGGGSSFISGLKGCVAVTAENDTTPLCVEADDPANQDVECSYHYSGYKFTDGVMIAGNESMTDPDGSTVTGHIGNGYARITLIN